MNIKEVLSLPLHTKLTCDGKNFVVKGTVKNPCLIDIESDEYIINMYPLVDILNMDFEIPKYYFFDVLHLDQESPLGVKVIIKEVILNCGYTVDIKKYLDEIDKPLSINRALTIFADLFNNDALTDILLNNGNFIVKENE